MRELVKQENPRLLPDLVSSHRIEAVHRLLSVGMPLDGRGELGATALHWACWRGYSDLVELLLAHGAPLDVRDTQYDGDPPGWFTHGLGACEDRESGDYAGVARALLRAGATFPKEAVPTGVPAVDAVFREYGL